MKKTKIVLLALVIVLSMWVITIFNWLKNLFKRVPPELDESHAEVRYTMAQMSRKEWEEYKKAMEADE